jgi:hypothetical protein
MNIRFIKAVRSAEMKRTNIGKKRMPVLTRIPLPKENEFCRAPNPHAANTEIRIIF